MKNLFRLLIILVCQMNFLFAQTEKELTIKYYCTNWGMTDSWADFCKKVKAAGYDGVETWLPSGQAERTAMLEALKENGLSLGLLAGGGGNDYASYYTNFGNNLIEDIKLKPDYINFHTCKDYYHLTENKKLI